MSTNLTSRTLAVLAALKGRSISGASVTEIAKSTRIPAPTVTRILATMIDDGYALKLHNERYAMSARMLSIAQAHANEISRTTDYMNELNQRVHAGANQ